MRQSQADLFRLILIVTLVFGFQALTFRPAQATPLIDCSGVTVGDELSLLYMWSGIEETLFLQILQPLVDQCGLVLVTNSTTDLNALDDLVAAGTPPDAAVWNVAGLQNHHARLQELDQLGGNENSYESFMLKPGTLYGRWVGLPVKVTIKSLVWYSPTAFSTAGYQVPSTWAELDALVEQMKTDGKIPWAMGTESAGATGWNASDFIQDYLLVQQGPEYVNNIIAGKVKYNDAPVRQAYQAYSSWAAYPLYTPGGATGTLTTHFFNAIHQVFGDPAEAIMLKQAAWVANVMPTEYPSYDYGVDFDFFVTPGVKGLQGGADWLMTFNDTPAVRALVAYLT